MVPYSTKNFNFMLKAYATRLLKPNLFKRNASTRMSLTPFRSFFDDDRFFTPNWSLVRPTDKDFFNPRVDVSSNDKEIQITAELAGVGKDAINVDFQDGNLTISGKKEEIKDDKEKHRYERRYGSFSRTVPLPKGVKETDISCTTTDGVLTVVVKKPSATAKSNAKRIKIN